MVTASALQAHAAWIARGQQGDGRLALRGLDLHGLDLHGRPLAAVQIDGCNLDGAIATDATWTSAWITGTSLRGARFTDTLLDGAAFVECDLRDADLSALRTASPATARGCRFHRCDLRGTVWLDRDITRSQFVDCRFDLSIGPPRFAEHAELLEPRLSTPDGAPRLATAAEILALWSAGRIAPGLSDDDRAFVHRGLQGRWRKHEARLARPARPLVTGVGTIADKWSEPFLPDAGPHAGPFGGPPAMTMPPPAPPPGPARDEHRISITTAADAAARGLPPVGVRVDYGNTGMFAHPRLPAGAYLASMSPPGGVLSFSVYATAETGRDPAAIQRAVDGVWGPAERRWGHAGTFQLAGAPRPALTYVSPAPMSPIHGGAALLSHPSGTLLVILARSLPPAHPLTCDQLIADPQLGAVAASFALLDDPDPSRAGFAIGSAAPSKVGEPRPATRPNGSAAPSTAGEPRPAALPNGSAVPSTTRDERLRWSPHDALGWVRGPAPTELSTVALAMIDQLTAAGATLDVVELAIVLWSRALDGLSPGPVPPDRLARLDADLALLLSSSPGFAPWNAALRAPIAVAHDLDWAIRFLMQAHQTWQLISGAR